MLLHMNESKERRTPPELPKSEGLYLPDTTLTEAHMMSALSLAEQQGAAWIYAPLNRATLVTLHAFASAQSESVHFVGYERITRPPTPPDWRRRCTEPID